VSCIPDVGNNLADELGVIDIGPRGDFAGQDDQVGRAESLAGDARERVIRQQGVEDAIGYLVGDFVGMPHAY
jgi:hypothetical protein